MIINNHNTISQKAREINENGSTQVLPSAGKVMAYVYWGNFRVIHIIFPPSGTTMMRLLIFPINIFNPSYSAAGCHSTQTLLAVH
jgi:hypothetical protein